MGIDLLTIFSDFDVGEDDDGCEMSPLLIEHASEMGH